MDLLTKFNRKNIDDRQIDTLIGLSKGLIADGKLVQEEAEFLMGWLVQSHQANDNPVIINLLEKVSAMLEDGVLDAEETKELFELLQKISGENSETGELAKTTSLPVNEPIPEISFEGMSFLFTGTCAFGTRQQCKEAVKSLGGINAESVTSSLNYLVLGTYVNDSWIHENYGRKIEKAMKYRDEGFPVVIVTEEHWVNAGNLID